MNTIHDPATPLPLALATCQECGQSFAWNVSQYRAMGYSFAPVRCPQCADRREGRPDVTVSRQEIFSVICHIAALPGEWQRMEPRRAQAGQPRRMGGDRAAWRMTVKGDQFGAAWQGRIDVWATQETPPAVGDIVRLTEMEVVKEIALQSWSRETLEHGRVTGERQVPRGEAINKDGSINAGCRITQETRRYIRLDPAPQSDPAGRELFWIVTRSKTTQKGFGRQYHEDYEASGLWSREVSGGVRSGRILCQGVLAVVDEDHPIVVVHREGGVEERTTFPTGVVERRDLADLNDVDAQWAALEARLGGSEA